MSPTSKFNDIDSEFLLQVLLRYSKEHNVLLIEEAAQKLKKAFSA